jgi:chloramphenicol 3-O-phosphotransferase
MPRMAFAEARTDASPRLRLRPRARRTSSRPIILAGADSAQRAAVLHELTHTLPEGSTFVEVDAFWEVLEQAPHSRMVIFSGDLEDGAAEAHMRTLRRRHPDLPVASLKTPSLAEL